MASKKAPDPLFTLRGDMSPVHCLLFHLKEGSEYLYASTHSGIIHKWNFESCREESQIKVSEEACLALKRIQQRFISQSKGGAIKVWEDENGTWSLKSELNFDYWGFCKFDYFDDKYLVFPASGSKVIIMTIDGKIKKTLATTSNDKCGEVMVVKCFEINKTQYVFALYESGVLKLFEASGILVSDWKITTGCPMALDFDGETRGVVGTSGDVVVGFQLASNLQILNWKETTITNPGVSCVTIRPDKKLVAAGCWDHRIRLFSMKTLQILVVLTSHRESLQDISFSLTRVNAFDAQWLLAAAGKDGRITLWNLY